MARFAIVITTHDRPGLLGRAIASAKAQPGDPQVVVVSDTPCAATAALAGTMLGGDDLFVRRAGAPGPAASRNVGIAVAAADYVLFLDDDDALSPGFLGAAAAHATPDAVLYTDLFTILERLEGEGPPVPVSGSRLSLAETPLDTVHVRNFIPQPCLIFPLRLLRGRCFEPSLVLNEDWDFILNVASAAPLRHVPIEGPVVYTRERADNRGRSNDHLLVDTYRRIYKRWPAPTPALKQARQALFASVGVEAALADL